MLPRQRCFHENVHSMIYCRMGWMPLQDQARCAASVGSQEECGDECFEPGLYVVGTPIGNLDDMTFRSVKVLNEVDRVLCEDTRRTRNLLTRFGVQARTESFHMHNEFQKQKEVISAPVLELMIKFEEITKDMPYVTIMACLSCR